MSDITIEYKGHNDCLCTTTLSPFSSLKSLLASIKSCGYTTVSVKDTRGVIINIGDQDES